MRSFSLRKLMLLSVIFFCFVGVSCGTMPQKSSKFVLFGQLDATLNDQDILKIPIETNGLQADKIYFLLLGDDKKTLAKVGGYSLRNGKYLLKMQRRPDSLVEGLFVGIEPPGLDLLPVPIGDVPRASVEYAFTSIEKKLSGTKLIFENKGNDNSKLENMEIVKFVVQFLNGQSKKFSIVIEIHNGPGAFKNEQGLP